MNEYQCHQNDLNTRKLKLSSVNISLENVTKAERKRCIPAFCH